MNKSDEITNKSLSELEKKLKKTYTQSYNELKKKTTQYFGDMGRREVELIEGLDSGSIKLLPNETKEEYLKQWRQAQMGRGKRWQALRDNMAKQIAKTNEIASAYINDKTPSIYSINANYQAYEIGKGLQGVDFTMYDEQTVKNLITENGNYTEFKTVKVNPVRDYEWNSEQIQNALTAGILQGQKIDQIADSFQTVMKRNQASAIRNARTAYTSAQNGGRLSGLKQAKAQGINVRKQWLSAHDGRVRDSHAMLNGQIRDIEERFDNGLMFPADSEGRPAEVYNCRCTLTYIYTDWDKDKSSEIYRDEALAGETYSQFVKRIKKENEGKISVNKMRYAKTNDKDLQIAFQSQIASQMTSKEIYNDLLTVSNADNNLPSSVRVMMNNIKVQFGFDGSACNINNNLIKCAKGLSESDYHHECGHFVEFRMMKKADVDAYKKSLVEGLTIADVKQKIYYDNAGNKSLVFVLHSDRFESEYQSCIYADNIMQTVNADGTINTDLMFECISVPFQKYMSGEKISDQARKLIEKAIK